KAFIQKSSKQLNLYETDRSNSILNLNQTEFLGVYYSFLYELLSKIIIVIGLDKLKHDFLLDLVILRMIEPASKLRSIELLHEYFGIKRKPSAIHVLCSLA